MGLQSYVENAIINLYRDFHGGEGAFPLSAAFVFQLQNTAKRDTSYGDSHFSEGRIFMLKFFKKPAPSGIEWLIVGLGNPGKEYEGTRHNVGFMALDRLAEKHHAELKRVKFKGLCGTCSLSGAKALLLKPSTFMNLSGQSVQEAMAFYKLPPERVIVLFDDINLEPGFLRIRRKGSDGGHNGMKNIIYLSGSDQFPRVKLGVGKKPHPDYDLKDWVLSRFTAQEQKALSPALDNACAAVELIVKGEIDRAMNLYN